MRERRSDGLSDEIERQLLRDAALGGQPAAKGEQPAPLRHIGQIGAANLV